MDHRDKLLTIVKEKGPLLPSQINREMRTNVLFASAMLAEMVDQKKLKLSAMRVGGSPLYYCEGQERSLEGFADKLGSNESSAFKELKRSRIIRDRDQEPQMRVALREIRDFAIPLEVTADGEADLFWKYYLISDDEASSLIKEYINSMKLRASKDSMPFVPAHETQKEPLKQAPIPMYRPAEVQATITAQTAFSEAPTVPVYSTITAPQVEVTATIAETVVEPQEPFTSVEVTKLSKDSIPEFSYEPAFSFSTTIDTEEKVKLERPPEPEPEPQGPVFPDDDDFFDKVKSFFDESGIEIIDFEMIRKGSEHDFTIKIPSNVGSLNYYCKAKSKSKLNEGDLSTAFVYGQMKKLPILFLAVGDLTKRAEELLEKEFRSMTVKQI
ncbi:MAG: hypothetical protein V1729_00625 [Candidatus Woesearchaeota archaeon]